MTGTAQMLTVRVPLAVRKQRGGRKLVLTLLAPDIVAAILDGRQPDGMTLPALMEPFPVEWAEQSVLLQAGAQKARVASTARNREDLPDTPSICGLMPRTGTRSSFFTNRTDH